MSNVIREYLVALGFQTNQPELDKFTSALDRLDKFTESSTESMAGSFAKFFVGANAGIATVAAGLVGLVDHVAMADQEYRLFAIHSYMNQDAAKGFKIALDSLGVSLGDIYRDTELYGRFTQLLKDQAEMQKGTGGDFEKTMRQARDLRFEFSRLHVEAQYGMMGMASAIFKGFGGEDFMTRFQHFNDWMIQNLPHLVQEISTELTPVLKDVRDIGKEVWHIFGDMASAFIKLTGDLSGDKSLKTGEVSFHNLAVATEKWTNELLFAVTVMDDVADSFVNLVSLDPHKIKESLTKLGSDLKRGPIRNDAKGGPLKGEMGVISGTSPYEDMMRFFAASTPDADRQVASITGSINTPTERAVMQAARNAGVPENIALSVAYQESRFNQSAVSPKGAVGVMQLMPGTAKQLGVDPNDEGQNIEGGMKYLRQLYDKFGDWSKAVQAYNSGPGNVMNGIVPKETQAYVPEVMGRAYAIEDAWGRHHAGSQAALQPMAYHPATQDNSIEIHEINIPITNPGASPEQIKQQVAEGVREGIGRQNAQNHFELSGSYA